MASDEDILEESGPAGDWEDDAEELEDDVDDFEEEFEDDDSEDGDAAKTTGEAAGVEEEDEALDELEAEELEMLTEDEEAETLPIDEAAELRKMRREAIALETGAEDAGSDEFVCSNCFQIKRMSQLANRKRKLCADCV